MSLFIDNIKTCKHYKNNLKIYTKCCNKYYDCIKCHNKNESHILDSNNINTIKCIKCNTDNELNDNYNNKCVNCETLFGTYHCLECKIWSNNIKIAFHCNGCKSCKLGDKKDFYHCDNCNLCLSVSTKDTHKCSNSKYEINKECPICLEKIYNLKDIILLLKCHHSIHEKCYIKLIKNTSYNKIPSCALCKKSLNNALKYENKFDILKSEIIIHDHYKNWKSNILCNDCNCKNSIKYHSHYHKCIDCNSYNTSVLDTIKSEET